MMKRREFITLLGGAAASWPLAARAQQPERMRRIGVLMNFAADDPEGQSRLAAFLQGLQEFGWAVGRNLRIDTRWHGGDAERYGQYAAELVALAPDVVLASASPAMMALQRAPRTGPIVFVAVADPVGAGFVDSLARPGGNITGFTQFEYGVSAKWLELLKEIAPRITRVAVLRNPAIASGSGQLGALQAVSSSFGVELRPVDVRNPAEMERALASFVRGTQDGLIATGGGIALQRKLIIDFAARHRLPAVYPYRYFVMDGGLISYGPDLVNQCREAASYVDRILKGEKPSDLPVQTSTKYRLVINLRTAKALGIDIPATLLARADEVIE